MKKIFTSLLLLLSFNAYAINELTPSEQVMLINFIKANNEISTSIKNIKVNPANKDGFYNPVEISRDIDKHIAQIIRKNNLTVSQYNNIVRFSENDRNVREFLEHNYNKIN